MIVAKSFYGSSLYGTRTPESDTDYKGIFIPSRRDLYLQRAARSMNFNTGTDGQKNSSTDVDCEYYSLGQFIHMGIQGETVVLDMLHTPKELMVETSDVWDYLHRHRHEFYTTHMKAYLGYVRKQAAKYGVKGNRLRDLNAVMAEIEILAREISQIPVKRTATVGDIVDALPTTEFTGLVTETDRKGGTQTFYQVLGRKYQMTLAFDEFHRLVGDIQRDYGDRARKAEASEGIDWKALSHAMRGALQLEEIYETGDLVFPLRNADELLAVKTGQTPFKEVQQRLEHLVDRVDSLSAIAARNGMRDKVDVQRWEQFVVDVYEKWKY